MMEDNSITQNPFLSSQQNTGEPSFVNFRMSNPFQTDFTTPPSVSKSRSKRISYLEDSPLNERLDSAKVVGRKSMPYTSSLLMTE